MVGDVVVMFNPHNESRGFRWNYSIQQIRRPRDLVITSGNYYVVVHTGRETQQCVTINPEGAINYSTAFACVYDAITDDSACNMYLACLPNELMKAAEDPYDDLL